MLLSSQIFKRLWTLSLIMKCCSWLIHQSAAQTLRAAFISSPFWGRASFSTCRRPASARLKCAVSSSSIVLNDVIVVCQQQQISAHVSWYRRITCSRLPRPISDSRLQRTPHSNMEETGDRGPDLFVVWWLPPSCRFFLPGPIACRWSGVGGNIWYQAVWPGMVRMFCPVCGSSRWTDRQWNVDLPRR